MKKYSIELTRDELLRLIDALWLLMNEAEVEQDKKQYYKSHVLYRQLLEVADGELAEFGGHPELVPTGEEPDEKPKAVCAEDIDTRKHVDTVNDYIIRNDPDVEIIIEGLFPRSCMAEQYFKGMLGEVPEKLRNVEVIQRSWSILNEMWVLGVARDPSLKKVQA